MGGHSVGFVGFNVAQTSWCSPLCPRKTREPGRSRDLGNAEEVERVDAPEAFAVVASPAVMNAAEPHQEVAVGLPGANPFE